MEGVLEGGFLNPLGLDPFYILNSIQNWKPSLKRVKAEITAVQPRAFLSRFDFEVYM